MNKVLSLIFIICCLYTHLAVSQVDYSVGLMLGGEINETEFVKPGSRSSSNSVGDMSNGFSLGIQSQIRIKKNWFARLGLSYNEQSYTSRAPGVTWVTDITEGPSSTSSVYEISSLGIPLDMGYRFNLFNRKLYFLAGLSVEPLINLSGTQWWEVQRESKLVEKSENSDLLKDPAIFSYGGFVGLEYQFCDLLVISIEPYLRHTPNEFISSLTGSTLKSIYEKGLTLRIRTQFRD